MKLTPYERAMLYDQKMCWQHYRKLQTLEEDKTVLGFSNEYIESLRPKHFDFVYIPKDDEEECKRVKAFIERYEWLGDMPTYTTHRFGAYLNGEMGGVLCMSTPYQFSKLLGEGTKFLEKNISRGASASWAPKRIASWMIAKALKWMVKNTQFRLFTCYADPEAMELGTIYQSLGFYYLGKKYGATKQYIDPFRFEKGLLSERSFGERSAFVQYSKKLGYGWESDWYTKSRKVNWSSIPDEVIKNLKQASRDSKKRCILKNVQKKHKYALIKSSSKKEEHNLKERFCELNPQLVDLPYPKVRGE